MKFRLYQFKWFKWLILDPFFPNTTIPNIVPKYVILYYTCHFKKIGASKTKDTEHENFNKYKKKETHSNDILSKLLYGFFTVVV